ncbi:hypothetical protein GCM10009733_053710 [Nonomuraea maheshkhaliensis]|uniref:Uncharacterized protein n=1 Tax=Nonomuraea maheshkhaliensis TaxID=419590 RepID=A0ABN2FJH7_9ACTN
MTFSGARMAGDRSSAAHGPAAAPLPVTRDHRTDPSVPSYGRGGSASSFPPSIGESPAGPSDPPISRQDPSPNLPSLKRQKGDRTAPLHSRQRSW